MDILITYQPERDFRQIKAPGEYYHLGLLGGGQYFFLTKSNILCEGFCSDWFDPIREHRGILPWSSESGSIRIKIGRHPQILQVLCGCLNWKCQ